MHPDMNTVLFVEPKVKAPQMYTLILQGVFNSPHPKENKSSSKEMGKSTEALSYYQDVLK
jgi:hypothetical protein